MSSAPVFAMVTVDRSPRENYLLDTLRNLKRSAWNHGDGPEIILCVGQESPDWACEQVELAGLGGRIAINCAGRPLCANLNVAEALQSAASVAADLGRDFVGFLEDDIDVCADFFDSVGAWLDDHAREDRRLYALGANYGWVEEAMGEGRSAADYPIGQFYGTQALALRSEDALSLSAYLVEHCYDRAEDGTAYDLLMADWALATWPEIRHFLASCPSFVQHTGRTSSIRPRPETHVFPSWPGREWSYLDRRAA